VLNDHTELPDFANATNLSNNELFPSSSELFVDSFGLIVGEIIGRVPHRGKRTTVKQVGCEDLAYVGAREDRPIF